MDRAYNPQQIEAKWQRVGVEQQPFRGTKTPSRPKFYCLEMFPYPSGRIHMGHVRNYAIGDVLARFKIMRGYNVLHPMGWDAFGLPAENAAIEQGVHPAAWTTENIRYMRNQLERLGISYDWSREINTCEPDYYKWNQWFFLKFYEKGLAYRKRSAVNWCPSCETVLANEQVEEGRCWRCESVVVQKELEQWFFRITAYAEELLTGCDRLPAWPARVLTMQRNWIGKSIGVEVDFPLAEPLSDLPAIRIFTTRQDTIFGATFMSLAPESPLVERLIEGRPEAKAVREFVARVSRQEKALRTAADREKEGGFTGACPVKPVTREPITAAYEEQAGTLVNSGQYSGLPVAEGKERIADFIETCGIGARTVNYRLRDWGISRQRYWGTPIPIIYCQKCGTVPVPEADLPVMLPKDVPFTGKGASPLAQSEAFVKTTCPKCKGPARRETDTMDTFVDSSWYFLRYCSPHETTRPVDPAKVDRWMAVDQYIGGIEHAGLPLLFAPFFTQAVRHPGLVEVGAPVYSLLTQGMVCMETYRCEEHGWLLPTEVNKDGWRCKQCGKPVERGRVEKMSKSRKNIVDPEHLIVAYGADTARLFSLFAAPPEKDLEWSNAGVEGAYRFLGRVWRLVHDLAPLLKQSNGDHVVAASPMASDPRRLTHKTIKKVTDDIEQEFQFNTAIAALMEFVNGLYKVDAKQVKAKTDLSAIREAIETLLILLTPFAPHIAEELWAATGHAKSLAHERWPVLDDALLQEEVLTIPVQVNGKLRSKVTVPADWNKERVIAASKSDAKVGEWIKGKPIKNVVYVEKRLVNIVVGDA